MRKIICIAAVLLLALAMTVPSLAATNYPAAINVPNGAATIDGIIEAGEWDEATRIEIVLSDILEDQDNGVPGAGLVGGPRPDVVNNDDIWLSVRMKVQDGYLYLLEERKDSTMQFTNDYYNHPYASAGSIIFFCEVGENLNSHDLFVLAETKSKTGPMFGWREQNDHAAMVEIFAEETKAAITANSFVLEAKIKLSDIGMTEQDMKDGKYLVTYCAVKITEPDFSGEPTDLWGENYQLQYKGVGPWDESVPIAVVAGAQWPPPAPAEEAEPEPEPEPDPVAEPEATQAPAAPVPEAPVAPASGEDMLMIFALMILTILSAVAFFGAKKYSKK